MRLRMRIFKTELSRDNKCSDMEQEINDFLKKVEKRHGRVDHTHQCVGATGPKGNVYVFVSIWYTLTQEDSTEDRSMQD